METAMRGWTSTEVEQMAQMCHEVNRSWCALNGDTSQKPWTEADQWQKDSAINGVKFRLANPDSKPEDSHNSWLKEKEATGWKYGEVKDVEKKEHPCFKPYNELPRFQNLKDSLFIAIVDALK